MVSGTAGPQLLLPLLLLPPPPLQLPLQLLLLLLLLLLLCDAGEDSDARGARREECPGAGRTTSKSRPSRDDVVPINRCDPSLRRRWHAACDMRICICFFLIYFFLFTSSAAAAPSCLLCTHPSCRV